jgi:hypothetical protein
MLWKIIFGESRVGGVRRLEEEEDTGKGARGHRKKGARRWRGVGGGTEAWNGGIGGEEFIQHFNVGLRTALN